MHYSIDIFKQIQENENIILMEFTDGRYEAGRLDKCIWNRIIPLDIKKGSLTFTRSYVKRIIGLTNFIVFPKKETTKPYKQLTIFEVSDILNKAGYEFI